MSGSTQSIGVNLRVTGHCNQGGRKYMEDLFTVAYQQTEDEKDLEYAFFGIFDGHGGREAALFAKEHLMDFITKQKNFWSEDDEAVLKAIREGFLMTQQAMWKDLPKWGQTSRGHPSTAGTTASIAFIKRGKIFVGHVGDSGIVLAEKDSNVPGRWKARPLTRDHKPECPVEHARIKAAGGKVVQKNGVPRVVWYRPRLDQPGPVRRSTPIDEVPFLAVARALGDLWSYNPEEDVFIVSPEPDLHVYPINILKDRCLILATDGAWNVLSPEAAVNAANAVERNNEKYVIHPEGSHGWINPSKQLVDQALERWNMCKLRADNISILTVMLDPPGPPRAQVLRKLHGLPPKVQPETTEPKQREEKPAPELPPKPKENTGTKIISRFPNSRDVESKIGTDMIASKSVASSSSSSSNDKVTATRVIHDSLMTEPRKVKVDITSKSMTDPSTTSSRKLNKIQCNEVTSSEPLESPPPPPLPERPPPPLPATRTRKPSLSREVAALQLSKVGITAAAPAVPVKQPRRSIDYNSDSENQPQINLRSRRASASSAKPDLKMQKPQKPQPQPRKGNSGSSRRSASSASSSSVVESPARVLRSHNATPVGGGLKRKRHLENSLLTSSASKILKSSNGSRKRTVTWGGVGGSNANNLLDSKLATTTATTTTTRKTSARLLRQK